MKKIEKIDSETVRADFNDVLAVLHYSRAAHFLGLWKSEQLLLERWFPDREALLLEAGCGAGRVSMGLWDLGYRKLAAFDFAEELVDQARSLFAERGAGDIHLFHADATRLRETSGKNLYPSGLGGRAKKADQGKGDEGRYQGALFMFNGLMQIPGRENRRSALRELASVCVPGAPLLFTTHDRDSSRMEKALWRLEAVRWERGEQDKRLLEFGDRYFEDEHGRTFMHLPDRAEILEDLESAGWEPAFDALRKQLASEQKAVRDFSDECRFWVARKR